jgi:hypothetical protein
LVVLVTTPPDDADRRAEPEPVRAEGNPLAGLERKPGGVEKWSE